MVETVRDEKEKISNEKQYVISSLALDAIRAAGTIQSHWGVRILFIGYWMLHFEKMTAGCEQEMHQRIMH